MRATKVGEGVKSLVMQVIDYVGLDAHEFSFLIYSYINKACVTLNDESYLMSAFDKLPILYYINTKLIGYNTF